MQGNNIFILKEKLKICWFFFTLNLKTVVKTFLLGFYIIETGAMDYCKRN